MSRSQFDDVGPRGSKHHPASLELNVLSSTQTVFPGSTLSQSERPMQSTPTESQQAHSTVKAQYSSMPISSICGAWTLFVGHRLNKLQGR
ncbi:hypothetical protein COCSUDRAFT_32514 [Coccomyxa subellipsoidea C-169]|uniref:Uncharacterized protein n=1 Tax=Coccomyxa subellipsoidea (strain C-169) TaxID=574566 RepID=I0Z6D4_COCSC|nr:hypothetical protein COCSUDRAFT_32514 [Coccomyxa subellipsoidea C-169]EIE26203.1 hypothetical protein COCSUDRAFT_32514 [Coccomyxa subellipsoidea C-169]|eukprot:XP_005650747.1 hypothetical protein COCSUDRAFT_32514 [Coccomyxa subellipsoidea C-169]